VQIYNFYFIYASARDVFLKKNSFLFFIPIYLLIFARPKYAFMIQSFLHKVVVVVVVCVCISCSHPAIPKPYGYFRIALPQPSYTECTTPHAQFFINQAAQLIYNDSTNHCFFNVHYPSVNATIHCTYMPIHHNLNLLLNDAQQMVYSHTMKASSIPEQEYINDLHHTYGMLYELRGNTATPTQFYLTDSTLHFFRASVYINTIPNQDSLAPVIEYLISDSRVLMETLQWK